MDNILNILPKPRRVFNPINKDLPIKGCEFIDIPKKVKELHSIAMYTRFVRVSTFYGIKLENVLIAQENDLEQKLGKKIQKILKLLQFQLLETEYKGTLPKPAIWVKQYFNNRRMVILFQRVDGSFPKTPNNNKLASIRFADNTPENFVEMDCSRQFTEEYLNKRK